jgi:hypothetical protein
LRRAFTSPQPSTTRVCASRRQGEGEEALRRFERLLASLPESADAKHASFQAGHLAVELERWDRALVHADRLLQDEALPPDERVEAMAIRAGGLLGQGDLEGAAHQAQQGLQYYRIRGGEAIPDEYFASSLNFTLAESIRLEASAMTFPDTTQDEQRAVLVKRAEMLLEAQREYFNTIRHTNAHWAAAAGHRIGTLYDGLWHDLMAAPVPKHLSDGAKGVYHGELAKLIKPLLRHAIRYWELTLMMVERTGVKTPWAAQTHDDLQRTRALLLGQPAGLGGLPPAAVDEAKRVREQTPEDSENPPETAVPKP